MFKFILFYIIFFNFNYYAHSQILNDTILKTYKKEIQHKNDSILKSYDNINSKKWLNLLPNISYNTNAFTGKNSFSIGFSLNSLTRHYQYKERNKIELLKIQNLFQEKLERNLEKLENEYLKILTDIDYLKLEIKNFKTLNEIVKLNEEQYKNDAINLETWLKAKLSYNNKHATLSNKINSLNLKIYKYQSKIKSPSDLEELRILKALKRNTA